MARLAFGVLVTGLLLGFNAVAPAAVPPTVTDPRNEMPPPGPTPPPARAAAPAVQRPSGNPLWGVPLRKLTASVARPLFAPTRRPPAAVEVKASQPASPPSPPKPKEKEKPQLTLLGTVAADSMEGIGLFLDRGDKRVVRLKTGEDHNGWVLRSVSPRQVVLEKGDQNAILNLPPPDTAAGPALPGGGAPVASFKPTPPVPAAPPTAVPPHLAPGEPGRPPGAAGGPPAPAPGNPFSGMVQQWMNQVSGQQPAPGRPKP